MAITKRRFLLAKSWPGSGPSSSGRPASQSIATCPMASPLGRGRTSLYSAYYNESRTHLSLCKDSPLRRAVQEHGTLSPRRFCLDCITATRDMIFGKDKGKGRYSADCDRSHGEITVRYPGFYEKHFFVMAITFWKRGHRLYLDISSWWQVTGLL